MSDLASRLQAVLGDTYRIERELGGGGMSRVFVAEEVELGRRVVVKVLPPEIAAGVNLERFRREIQVAASLQHPHIVPLLTAGHAGDLLYYTMPLIEGESLRARLARQRGMPVSAVTRILRDVTDALACAHRHAVVHRDIKPDNVLLSDEHALVTDFGVAKAISAATGASTLTTAGVALGTPAYMAPEQAAADPETDHRCDIYAVGTLAYEMLTGRPPFTASSPQQVLAAQVTVIPDPPSRHRGSIPPALEAVVMRCLEKAPAARWQTAEELRHELEATLTPRGGGGAAWAGVRRRLRPLWAVGVAGMVTVALAGGWLVWRGGAAPATTGARTAIAVLPFSVRGGDELGYLGDGMVDLLSTKLDGAGDLRSVDARAVLGVVARQGGPLHPERARNIARGLGAGFFVLGNVLEVGGRVRLDASLYDAGRREALAQGSAEGAVSGLFELVDALAAQLLAGLRGGPSARVTRIAAVTTSSLPALKAYLEGESYFRAGRFAPAIESYQRAAAQDSLFALAYYRLSIAAEYQTQAKLAREAAEQAVRHAGRLASHDRQVLEAFVAWRRGAVDDAEHRYRAIVASYPDDLEAWFELGEVLFHYAPLRGRPIGESREAWQRILALEPEHGPALIHLARLAAREGRREELDSLVRRGLALFPEGDRALEMRALRAFATRDSAGQEQVLGDLRRAPDVTVILSVWSVALMVGDIDGTDRIATLLVEPTRVREAQALGLVWRAHLALARGRRSAAARELALADQLSPGTALEYGSLWLALPFLPISRAELERARDALARWDAKAVPPVAATTTFFTRHDGVHEHLRAYLVGLLSARLGDAAAAGRQAATLERLGEPRVLGRGLARSVRAEVARAARRAGDAVSDLEKIQVDVWYQLTLASPFYSQAYARFAHAELLRDLGRNDEARRWYATLPGTAPDELAYVGPVHLGQATIAERLGRRDEAVAHYRRFVELWKDCDPELRPLLHDVQRQLARLTGS